MYGARTGIRTETQVSEEPRGVTRSLTSNHPSVPVRATKNQTGIGSDIQNQNQISLQTRILILFISDSFTLFFRARIRCSS
jgi:hypothetical protein